MFFLMGNNDKSEKKAKRPYNDNTSNVKELFRLGRFPVVTTQEIEGRKIAKVLGLVCCRGFDADEAFFGMATMAQNKGGQAIIGYNENVAFHPDGSKFFSCFGTAIMFERESRDVRDMYENTQPMQVSQASTNVAGKVSAKQSVSSAPSASKSSTTQFLDSNEDDIEDLLDLAVSQELSPISEEEDPVLQRLLAQKKLNTPNAKIQ